MASEEEQCRLLNIFQNKHFVGFNTLFANIRNATSHKSLHGQREHSAENMLRDKLGTITNVMVASM